jgi:hypothetical protein
VILGLCTQSDLNAALLAVGERPGAAPAEAAPAAASPAAAGDEAA